MVHYDFEETSHDRAEEKAKAYARSAEIRRKFFFTDDSTPSVKVMTFIDQGVRRQERAYLVD